MSIPDDAQKVYEYLTRQVVPSGKVTTYGAVSQATAVPIGEDAAYMTQVLRSVFVGCDSHGLPPLTAIVVQIGTCYDNDRHGQVGTGYLFVEADSPNDAGRFRSESFTMAIAGRKPRFDRTVGSLPYRDMIEHHQDSVWEHASWPEKL